VHLGGGAIAPGQDEGPLRLDVGAEPVNVLLNPGDVHRRDPGWRARGPRRCRELGVGEKDLVLEADEELHLGRGVAPEGRRGSAEVRVQLVESAERADARRVLLYARATNETGRAAVTGAGIEAGRGYRTSVLQGSASRGDDSPWTPQYEMRSTSLCFASCRHSRQMNPLRSPQAPPTPCMASFFR
jgi:hypothetical protein